MQMVNNVWCSQETTPLSEEVREILKGQIEELWNENSPVRVLVGESHLKWLFLFF